MQCIGTFGGFCAKGFMNGPIACNALEHLEASGTKGFMSGTIACNALEHLEASSTKILQVDLLYASYAQQEIET